MAPLNSDNQALAPSNGEVAEEHGGADNAQEQHEPCPMPERARGQRGERKRAAFAVVVGPEQDQHIFQRNDDDQRPEDQ